MTLRYLSLFSGIEAACVAFAPLGWTPVAFAETDPFASAVLAHHWPDVPNLGDVTAIDWSAYRGTVDLVIGGPPCQAFSIAGRRRSLDDDRGNLSLAYVRAIRAVDPRWAITENVPGWLNTRDNAFGCYLAGLVGEGEPLVCPLEAGWPDAGMVVGPERTAAWRVLDAQYFGLAQRRRRVFVVSGRTRDGTNPGAVLLEPESGGRHPAPSRTAGTIAPPILAGGTGTSRTGNENEADYMIPVGALSATGVGVGGPDDNQGQAGHLIAHGGVAATVSAKWAKGTGGPSGDEVQNLIAYQCHGTNVGEMGTLRRGNGNTGGGVPFVTHTLCGDSFDAGEDGRGRGTPLVAGAGMAVRRLLPVETERLQGFADGHTLIPYRGKIAADGPRYKGVGNSMAIPVVRWIGERIALVERLRKEGE